CPSQPWHISTGNSVHRVGERLSILWAAAYALLGSHAALVRHRCCNRHPDQLIAVYSLAATQISYETCPYLPFRHTGADRNDGFRPAAEASYSEPFSCDSCR